MSINSTLITVTIIAASLLAIFIFRGPLFTRLYKQYSRSDLNSMQNKQVASQFTEDYADLLVEN